MNPSYRKSTKQGDNVRRQYLSNLALEASNNQKNLNANQIYKETGSSPNQVTDKRTTTYKYAGGEGMKQLVRDTIAGAEFMNAIEAGQAVDKMNGEDIDFFLKFKSFILTDFKGRGAFEVMGSGMKLNKGDLGFKSNMATYFI